MKNETVYEAPELDVLMLDETDILSTSDGEEPAVTEQPGIELPRDEW